MTVNTQIPSGYKPFPPHDGFIGLSGPFFFREPREGAYYYGFQSDDRHKNPNNVIAGAALITFADTCFGHIVEHASKKTCATIALHTEFIKAVPAGGWIELHARIKRVTGTLAYVDGDVTCADDLLLTTSAVWRLFDAPTAC